MGIYEDIQNRAAACIIFLEKKSYTDGNFEDLRITVCENSDIIIKLNDYVNVINSRIILLEREA